MGISGSDKALMYALSNVARAGATRSGYTSPALFIAINGTPYATARTGDGNVLQSAGLSITEVLHQIPNTASFTLRGVEPSEGSDVVITLGSINNAERQFAGTLLNRTHAYVGTPANWRAPINAIDYTWHLTRRRISGYWTNTTATVIGNAIVALIPGFTSGIIAGLPTLDTFSVTDVDCLSALTQLAKRIGGYCDVDYHKVVKLFLTDETVTNPVDLTSSHLSLMDFQFTRDLSPVRTRIFVIGGGVNAAGPGDVGQTSLPLDGASSWYNPLGGTVRMNQQHVTYTGVQAGGAGSLVGPGVGPSSAPTLALAAGAGVETGAHNYAVTFVTAAGESLPSPSVSIATGTIPIPTIAPTLGAATSGLGVTPGAHQYAITFVNAAGETVASPLSTVITVSASDPGGPLTAPSVADGGVPGGGLTVGAAYLYCVTFDNSAGQTGSGPFSAAFVAGANADTALTNIPTGPAGTSARHLYRTKANGSVFFRVTAADAVLNDNTTTAMGPEGSTDGNLGVVMLSGAAGGTALTPAAGVGGSLSAGGRYRWRVTFVSAAGETNGSDVAVQITSNTQANPTVITTATPHGRTTGDTVVIAGNVGSNASINGSQTITVLSPTTFSVPVDCLSSGGTGGSCAFDLIAGANTYGILTNIPLGPAGTTRRRLYRTKSNGTQYFNVAAGEAALNDNTTTTFNDVVADGSLASDLLPNAVLYQQVPLSAIPLGGGSVTSRKLYRTAAGGSQLKLLATIADNTTTIYSDSTADGSLGANVPTSNTATANQVSLSAIAIGAASVTSRKLYRTVAAGSQLKLLATIADNTTTTYADSTADGSLGANVPTSDTSGLTQPNGVILPGQTTLVAAGVAWASASGGWAIIGNGQQAIRYTGISGNTLTGIPTSGTGSVSAAIAYNSTVTAAPALTGIPASGVGSIQYAILKGDPVNLLVQCDDISAQATLATLLGNGDDGVVEDTVIDQRLGETEARALGVAQLAFQSTARVSISYRSRDINTHAGRTITVNLGAPTSVTATFQIQHVTIANFQPALYPTYTVQAANDRFSLEDLLRLARQAA